MPAPEETGTPIDDSDATSKHSQSTEQASPGPSDRPVERPAVATTTVDARPAARPPRLRQQREMLDSIGAARRFVAAFVERTRRGDGGLAELAAIVELEKEICCSIDAIAKVLLTNEDCSYREIGVALGITGQAAAKRYPGASSRPAGGQPSWLR